MESKTGEILPCYVYTGSTGNNYCPAVITDEDEVRQVLEFMDGKTASPLESLQ